MINRDEFLREMTLRICSSLSIKETLRNAFEYLREHFPLDGLALSLLDERIGAVRQVTDRGYPVREVAGRLGGKMISDIAEAIQALERGWT